MNKELVAIFEYLEREKGIDRSIIITAIEEALQVAARKSAWGSTNASVSIHPKTGDIQLFLQKEVVEKVRSPILEISLKEAQAIDPNCEMGDSVTVESTPKDFGRIAAQKARQLIAQKLREAERDVIYDEYRDRLHQIISGTVKRIGKGSTVIVDLGKVEGILPRRYYPPNEEYNVGDKVLALLYEVRDTENGGAEVVLSRSHPEFVRELLIQEVPELSDGTISIEAIAREPGYRTKVIVRSKDMKVDPVGACIGLRGIRIKNIVRELNNEKIDVIPYSQDTMTLLKYALDPIEIKKIRVNDDDQSHLVVVSDDVFGTAIGKKGFNVRLIGELLDIDLEIQKMSEYQKISELERTELAQEEDPTLDEPIDTIEGLSKLVAAQLAEDYPTKRKLLMASVEELTRIPGISLELADKILEQIRKKRV